MQFSRAILFICYVVVNLANAQQLRFEQFTTKDGLLSDEVYNLHQDKRGYIWAFTKYGAMKYTGSAFVPVLRNLPWKESVIYAIYENPAGRKWIANSNKNIYEIVHDSAFKVPGTEICSKLIRQKTNEIVKLFVDDSLHLYVQTTLRSYKLHKEKNGRYSLFDLNTQWRKVDDCDEHVIAIGSTYMSVPFIHPVSGNFDLVSRHIRFHSESGPLKDPGISIKTSLRVKHCKRFGRVWYLSFSDQIFRINPDGTWREKKIDGFVLNFIKDRRGHLWIASYRGGLLEFDENDSLLHQYFPGKTVHDVLPDNHNGLWVSTDGAGIYHCRNIDELHYEESTALGKPVNFMRQIGERLFIATTDQRLFCIYKGRVVPLPKAQTKIADDPQGIYCRDSLYLVSYRIHYERLELHPSGKFVVEKTASETSNHVPVYFVDGQNSSLLFMGRNRVGLLQDITRLSGSKPFALKNVLISQKALCVLKHGSDLLVGTDQGVFVFRNDSLVRPGYLQATEHLSVTRIVEDRDGNVWFCTKGNGLIKMRPNRDLVNYSSSSGMASDIINDISFVGKNGVLISCNRGLYYYTFLPLAKHQAALRLLDGEIVCSMVFDGKIYVGTKNGLVTIDARSLQPLPSAFFNLSSVWINGESKAENRLCKLKHDENNLKFCFDVIRFSQGSSGLHYLLCSPDIDSGSVSENEINLKRLSPGDYTLTVKPAGENSQRVMSIPFLYNPPYGSKSGSLSRSTS